MAVIIPILQMRNASAQKDQWFAWSYTALERVRLQAVFCYFFSFKLFLCREFIIISV